MQPFKSHPQRALAFAIVGVFLLMSFTRKEKLNIICWGDSLTAPHANCYPSVLAEILGDEYNVINCGVGGENTLDIMARQGAFPMRLTHDVSIYNSEKKNDFKNFLGNRDIPAFESSYNNKVITPLLQCGYNENSPAHINPCYINGKEYELSSESEFWKENKRWVFQYNYFISTNDSTDTYVIPKGSIVETQAMRELRNQYANIFFIGQNGGFSSASELIYQIQCMINYSECDRYIVISSHRPWNNSISKMTILEDSMKVVFGPHYINLREYMVGQGLQDAGLTPTIADIDSISHGETPPQLLSDQTHFNAIGYRLLGTLVAKKFKELGY